jgi:hypothetical protein
LLISFQSDQPKEGIAANRDKMNEFCQQQGFSAWFETSAKDNINIDESANFLVSKASMIYIQFIWFCVMYFKAILLVNCFQILEMDKWSQEPSASDPEKVDLSGSKGKAGVAANCAC